MAADKDADALKFSTFNSTVDPSFFHKLQQIKLEIDRLEEKPRQIWGQYSNISSTNSSTLNVDCSSFNSETDCGSWALCARGSLLNVNTIEGFRDRDKAALLAEHGTEMWRHLVSGEALKDPSLLISFLVFSFADLKKHVFYYWFAFPALPLDPCVQLTSPPSPAVEVFPRERLDALVAELRALSDWRQRGFFSLDDDLRLAPLADVVGKEEGVTVGFCDPGTSESHPGWPLRNLLALIACQCPRLSRLRVLCLRLGAGWTPECSLVLELALGGAGKPEAPARWLGWERNERGKLGPRRSDLGLFMDPVRLAEASVDLNLQLMKWRLLPALDLALVRNARCLLLGAGTLGCAVARNLLAWGVRRITLVDCGRVSYSNPVRQSLFSHVDCIDGGQPKAVSAAAALKAIFPGVDARGVSMAVPMAGHSVGPSALAQTRQDVDQLEKLVADHDAVFMLMDSRESRWLPTLIAASTGKIAMTAALGFDTFLVMRHGSRSGGAEGGAGSSTHQTGRPVAGSRLGCYFCNDVTAPGNSQHDRSLDMQCTVTRPGVSNLASALAVELFVSLLQHPLGAEAPADSSNDVDAQTEGCVLGSVPHSLRGFLSRFEQLRMTAQRYAQCVACSTHVVSAYERDGFDFLLQAFNSPRFLEDLTGITQSNAKAAELEKEIWEMSDSDGGEME